MRIGKFVQNSPRPRPLKVSVKTEAQKQLLLSSGKNLRESEIANHVFVDRDLTKDERDKVKNVRALLRERRTQNPAKEYMIYRGKIVEKGAYGPSIPTDTEI